MLSLLEVGFDLTMRALGPDEYQNSACKLITNIDVWRNTKSLGWTCTHKTMDEVRKYNTWSLGRPGSCWHGCSGDHVLAGVFNAAVCNNHAESWFASLDHMALQVKLVLQLPSPSA